MINHARTLLLNESPADRPAYGENGEEYIPAGYTRLQYPGYLMRLRNVFLGSGSDPLYQNYRLAQLMAVAHSNDVCRDLILGLDSRITYDPMRAGFERYISGDLVTAVNPKGMTLELVGYGQADDKSGRAAFSWRVQTEGTSSLRVRSNWRNDSIVHTLVLTDNRSQLLPLDNGLSLRLYVPAGAWDTGAFWDVTSNTRPQTDLGEMLLRARAAGAESISEIFRGAPTSYWNLWKRGQALPDVLGGLLAAMVARADEVLNA